MAIPTFAEMIQPLLVVLGSNEQGIEVGKAYGLVATATALSEEDRALMVPSKGRWCERASMRWR